QIRSTTCCGVKASPNNSTVRCRPISETISPRGLRRCRNSAINRSPSSPGQSTTGMFKAFCAVMAVIVETGLPGGKFARESHHVVDGWLQSPWQQSRVEVVTSDCGRTTFWSLKLYEPERH